MIQVEKYHGTGNDFVIVDADADVPDRRAFARRICDRETGIDHPASPRVGADGVLFLALEAGSRFTPPRAVMTLVQPDGSVAAMCGNGARCAAEWAARRLRDRPEGFDGEVMIDTQSGTRRATVGETVTIEMGQPTFAPDEVPVEAAEPVIEREVAGLTITAVNTGVPHAVALVEDVDAIDLATVAPPVRHADVFPRGANVTLAARDGDGYRQRTFERGVEGETDSCGTGAVAVGAVAHRLGHVETGETVHVSPPGGTLDVTVTERGSTLCGPVAHEFSAEVAAGPLPADD
ncbi:diaminopimelate epimerase [Halosegnis sp.]|uniref:diaminopimelate epimerase n=1 Tax=Halosegnis sp. TaxID=2864959 RepID=UPI0035D47E32